MNMDIYLLKRALKEFHGTKNLHKFLYPGVSPLHLSDACHFILNTCDSWWLFEIILLKQSDKVLKDVHYQVWSLQRMKKNLIFELSCREGSGKVPLIILPLSSYNFPLDKIELLVIRNVCFMRQES